MPRTCGLLALFALMVFAPAVAAEEAIAGPDELARAIKAAVDDGNYVALDAACTRVKDLLATLCADELDPIVRALGEGVKSRDVSIALLSVKTLGETKDPGAYVYLARLLSPARNPASDDLKLHLAAIDAASMVGSRKFVLRLEKLILHDDTQVAVAAAEAIGRLERLQEEERIELVSKIAIQLGRMELRRPAKQVDKVHLEDVKSAIVDCLRRLTNETGLATADDFRAWARTAAREGQSVT